MTTTIITIGRLRWEFSSEQRAPVYAHWALFALASLFIIAGALQ